MTPAATTMPNGPARRSFRIKAFALASLLCEE